MSRSRQVSFVKEVYHSSDEASEGNWVALSQVYTSDRKENYIQPRDEDTTINLPENEVITPASWEKMIETLETKCEIDSTHLQFKLPLYKQNPCYTTREVWKAQLWHIDVVVKKIKLSSNILSETLSQEVNLLK